MKRFIGAVIGTIGLLAVFICGGAPSILGCALIGGSGLACLMIGGALMGSKEDEDGEDRTHG